MGLIAKIRAWWRESTVCEKHGWHPPTQVCRMCFHEVWIKEITNAVKVQPFKSAEVLAFEAFKKNKEGR